MLILGASALVKCILMILDHYPAPAKTDLREGINEVRILVQNDTSPIQLLIGNSWG